MLSPQKNKYFDANQLFIFTASFGTECVFLLQFVSKTTVQILKLSKCLIRIHAVSKKNNINRVIVSIANANHVAKISPESEQNSAKIAKKPNRNATATTQQMIVSKMLSLFCFYW